MPFDPASFHYQPYQDFRGNTPPAEPIVAIEYSKEGKDWRPGIIETTEAGYGFTYCHGGEVALDDGCSHGLYDDQTKTLGLPKYCWADGKRRLTPIWINPALVHKLTFEGQPITRKQARRHGFRILPEPIPYNRHVDEAEQERRYTPFGEAEEMHYEWCNVCLDYFASEHECCHLRWQEGGYFIGCGANDMDLGAAQRSLFELLEVLPPEFVRIIRDELRSGNPRFNFGDEWEDRDADLGQGYGSEIDKDVLAREPDAEARYWEGMCWLHSLDKHATEAVSLTRGWLWQWEQQKWKGTCVLHEHILHYSVSRAAFEEWFALPANDTDALLTRRLVVDLRWLKNKNASLNTTNFLKAPADAPQVFLMIREPERKKHNDHRHLKYRIAEVKHDKKQAVLTLARCLDHDGKHPSFLPGYEIVPERQLEWLRRPKQKAKAK